MLSLVGMLSRRRHHTALNLAGLRQALRPAEKGVVGVAVTVSELPFAKCATAADGAVSTRFPWVVGCWSWYTWIMGDRDV
jgi:hypothetical protein